MVRDLLGREYIDCLGGYGIFSAGINHPRIVKAVTDQIGRMALNSQEILMGVTPRGRKKARLVW